MTPKHFLCCALLLAFACQTVSAHGDEPHAETEVIAQQGIDTPMEGDSSSATDTVVQNAAQGSVLDLVRAVHPATVHFPIALLIAAAVTEVLLIFRPEFDLKRSVRLMVYFAAIGTVAAAVFGWLHTGMWLGGEAVMQRHRSVGTGLAVLSVGLAWLVSRPDDAGRTMLRIGLLVAAIVVVIQGYWGAELSHGPNHLFQSH
jgi:uncharacterized membrane protein